MNKDDRSVCARCESQVQLYNSCGIVIDKIPQQPVLVNVMDLKAFWGLLGYWPTFIHCLAYISCSLHNLIKSIMWD